MRDFSKFPETQLNYLESYVTKNEKDIESTIGESAYQHTLRHLLLVLVPNVGKRSRITGNISVLNLLAEEFRSNDAAGGDGT